MSVRISQENIVPFDERRHIAVPGDHTQTLKFCVDHFIQIANESIHEFGCFNVALSGGSTPKAIFEMLSNDENKSKVQWEKVFVFWSDERSVAPTDEDSNYKMAMDAGFSKLAIPNEHIFRMIAEKDIEANAEAYEELIKSKIENQRFDLIMLGMGPDGHTASLFPHTEGLHIANRLVIPNFVTQKDTWRMTFTYELINAAKNIAIYVLGESKASMLHTIFHSEHQPDEYPIQRIGTSHTPALWIADQGAAAKVKFVS